MIVLKPFTDKHTKRRYKEGETFEGSEERCNELMERGLLKPKEKPTVTHQAKEKMSTWFSKLFK